MNKWLYKLSYTRIIALSFVFVILLGSLLLMLPVSSVQGTWTPFIDTLFTSVSATCVTGLAVYDTGFYWSFFGQIVILCMIQIGGLGFMTVISMFSIFLKRKISLTERQILMQSAGNMRLSGMVRLVKRIILGTVIFELTGALLLAIRFIPRYGFWKGIYFSIFHSISAFCNAGFDLLGNSQSFTAFEGDWLLNITIMFLIVIGGIGFLVWGEIHKNTYHFSRYSLHAKIVLLMTIFLIIAGSIGFFLFEYHGNLEGYPIWKKILSSTFMSVTTRTAGFNTMRMDTLSNSSILLSLVLMFIGGSPGSTAGGIKTTTAAVVILALINLSKGKNDVTIFKKRLDNSMIKHAAVIIITYLSGILFAGMAICAVESFTLSSVIFEIVSAAGTVGLSQGITSSLCAFSKLILIVLMYGGRIGGFSLLMVFRESSKEREMPLRRPVEKILIG
ncbi:MAG: potassium transporter TrkG [Lachnospiraceae bacterium]|nr:potassium transporter TrkG [Lachnospiraceae bacterium]